MAIGRSTWCFVIFMPALLSFACSDSTAPSVLCQEDSDCDDGMLCRQGACRAECVSSSDCSDGEVCVSGACLVKCQSDDQCPEDQRCVDGYCHGVDPSDGGSDGGQQDGGEEKCDPGSSRECGTDEGACQKGTQTCDDNGTWSQCQGSVEAAEEQCNQVDDDCDGLTDEDVVAPPGTCPADGVCADSNALCQQGQWHCQFPPEYEQGDEVSCDGLDNDCDGLTDELLQAPADACPTEGICAAGMDAECSGGQWKCAFPEGYEEGDELSCDGLDNDCDGLTDEWLTQPPAGTCLDQGVCSSAVAQCVSGHWVCQYNASFEQGEEVSCDGLDNDCDGDTDEDLQADRCSIHGVCAGTIAHCTDGNWICDYPPEYEVPDTTCDGVDNDCDGVADSGIQCAGQCCALGEICRFDTCLPDLGNCTEDGDCQDDSYCDNGDCIPYGQGPRGETNPECSRLIVAGLFQPAIQCQWTQPPPSDPYPAHVQVLGTPTVADFDFDGDPNTVRPSIVFNTYDGLDGDSGCITDLDGVLRIIDGATCQTLYSIGPYLNGSNPVAIGDLDLDGRPEIVAHMNNGAVTAYTYDPVGDQWQVKWVGHDQNGAPVSFSNAATGWGGPSLADLNDDGAPEVLSGGLVYDSQGLLIDSTLGLGALFGIGFPVVADIDDDGLVEMAGGNAVWEFDPIGMRWTLQANGPVSGYTAVADFGTYNDDPAQDNRSVLDGIAEVVIVVDGQARISSIGGRTVFGPVSLPASSGGGPPTVGDFDGDGRAEFAASGSDSMTIFDPDCLANPVATTCPSMRSDGILWSKPSQDHSSNITGSSLFDFEGDGLVEAVYADECFVRVYRGSDGEVMYSQWRSSCTWNENPIVADVDGDYTAELVVPSNQSCGIVPQSMGSTSYETSPHGNPMDPLFVGLPCEDGADCASSVCDAGYCRCTSDDQCPNAAGGGFVCAPPPAATPGSGNTCRSEWLGSINGIRVYRDSLDRWVGSRTIWNQHAYSITNILENGTVPSTSAAELNWQVSGLNNFRQNIQGDLNPHHSPDLTSGQGSFGDSCDAGNKLPLYVRICNRGTNPIASGVNVGFFDGDPDAGGALVCSTPTLTDLEPGDCEDLTCVWTGAPVYDPHDVTVVVDWDSARTECLETNNRAMIYGATCPYM